VDEKFSSATAALNAAKIMTEERLVQFPKYGPYIHASEQISFIERVLAEKRPPTSEEKENIDIALMAIKELDSSEPEYSEALCELSFHFKKL
jgi:hypothetical protein